MPEGTKIYSAHEKLCKTTSLQVLVLHQEKHQGKQWKKFYFPSRTFLFDVTAVENETVCISHHQSFFPLCTKKTESFAKKQMESENPAAKESSS